jgi:hypothetical protein
MSFAVFRAQEGVTDMSKNNNVNPGQYKVGGREHPGEKTTQDLEKQKFATAEKQSKHGEKPGAKREK